MSIPDYVIGDYIAAIKRHLESQAYLASRDIRIRPMATADDASGATELSPHLSNIITITGIPGFGQHSGLMMNPRFEIRSWGSNGYEAMLGWRLAHTALCPPPGDPNRKSSFTYYGSHVYDIAIVSTPITLIDPTGWESRSAFYAAKVLEIPI